jgi:hypothetical protein
VVKLAGRRYPAGLEDDAQSQVDILRAMPSPGHPFEEEWGRQLAAAIPGARFVEYPTMGHEMPRHLFGSIVDEIHGLTKASG